MMLIGFVEKVVKIEMVLSQAEASGHVAVTQYTDTDTLRRHYKQRQPLGTWQLHNPASEWLLRCLLRVILCTWLYKLSPLHKKTTNLRWDGVIYIAISLTRWLTWMSITQLKWTPGGFSKASSELSLSIVFILFTVAVHLHHKDLLHFG